MSKKAFISWGGWDGHEPAKTSDIMRAALEEEDYEVRVENSLELFEDADFLADQDIVIPCWTMSQISNPQTMGLLNAIKNGTGCAGWHGGMGDSFRNNTEYQFMVGGQFICHPGGVIDYEVEITSDDPIVNGLSKFKMNSEQYFMHVDPSNEVLATTTFSGDYWGIDWVKDVVMPVCWKKTYGKGRVFYSALGHVASDFNVPEAKEIMKRGVIWATR